MIKFFLLTLTPLVAAAATQHDYPAAPPPSAPPARLQQTNNSTCSECPWDRAELGAYPRPFNVGPSYSPEHRGKHFDVYGHWIETHYSEVFWTAQPAVPLPADVVAAFKGRPISFTGFEVDVVAGGENNVSEWSIPEFQVYKKSNGYCPRLIGMRP